MKKIAYVIEADWREDVSGVSSFVRLVHDAWLRDLDCVFVERPQTQKNNQRSVRKIADDRKVSSVRLLAGYIRDLFDDIAFVQSVKSAFKDRIIVTNQFGAETLPVALRIVNPFSKIIAIAHTHPGMRKQADRYVLRAVEKICYRVVSDIIYNSNSVRQEWAKKLGKKEIKGSVIWYGLDNPDTAVPDDYPAKEDGVIDFVCVARFVEWKGHAKLLDAWKLATGKTNKNMRLILIGAGPCFEESKRTIEKLGLTNVICLGSRPNGARYFNGCDVGILLSIEPEAFGQVLVEAMSRGLPVIAGKIGGIPEVVEHEKNGLLVDPFDGESAASAICRLAESQRDRKMMGDNGRDRWRRCFTVDRMLKEYTEYFQKL